MTPRKHAHIGVFFQSVGYGVVWRHPDYAKTDVFATYVRFAQSAERGLLDFVFFGEGLVVREHRDQFFGGIANGRPDSLALIPALAATTAHVGFVATVSSTYNQPFELARQLASIDHVTGGRMAWNVVTSFSNSLAKDSGGDQIAFNFSKEKHLAHATRYDRAREFVTLIKRLWDSWAPAAVVDGQIDATQVHAVNHHGTWFDVNGPLDVPRTPQGHPVIVQAGQSEDGRDLAARITDVVFSPHRDLAESKAYRDDIKQRMQAHGRDTTQLRVLPGLAVLVAPTEAEAQAKAAYYRELLFTPAFMRYLLSEQSGYDFANVDLDAPFPAIDTNNPDINGALIGRWMGLSHTKGLTVAQTIQQALPLWTIVGTPAQIADHIEQWLDAEACDGFLLTPSVFPNDLDDFVDLVIPELQRRGRFRTAYPGTTLRDSLGIAAPTWAHPVVEDAVPHGEEQR
jgi:N-acetyl-S-(2-succino)cysteine monooxygenase